MPSQNRTDRNSRPVLATDLDGTFIPLEGESANRAALETFCNIALRTEINLAYVTGRHLASVRQIMHEQQLPTPDWIMCDVGTAIYHVESPDSLHEVREYCRNLDEIIFEYPINRVRTLLADVAGLRLQEPFKQGRFKLSYYTNQAELEGLTRVIIDRLRTHDAPYSVIHSVDPFTGDGLIDLLPRGVSKAHALEWWVEYSGHDPQQIVFAGDSGNDRAAFLAGYRTIIVGNADQQLASEIEMEHRARNWHDRLFLASSSATSGVLEGCQYFGLLPKAYSAGS